MPARPGSPQWDESRASRGSTSRPGRASTTPTRSGSRTSRCPFGYIADYIDKVKEGVDLDRPVAALHAERDRVVSEYRDLLDSDEDRAAFDAKLGLSRTVFPYVENHNFYVEHWAHSVIWRKMRAFGEVLVGAGFFEDVDDVFMLKRYEVADVLFDYYSGWAVGAPSRGPGYWPQGDRASQGHPRPRCATGAPPPALGVPPEVVTEPFTVMLWGITSDSVSGLAAAPARRGRRRLAVRLRGLTRSGRGPGAGHLRRRRDRRPSRTARSWSPR